MILEVPLPWQATQWVSLQRRYRSDALSHAILLCGAPGLGKEHFALAFTKSIYCRDPQRNYSACGVCPECHQFDAGTLGGYRHLTVGDGSLSIGIDQVREFGELFSLSQDRDRPKVGIVSPADLLNINAANGLLKTLEEPRGKALIFLVTARPAQLPLTIRSRCQRIQFDSPPLAQAVEWLSARGVEHAAAALCVSSGPLQVLQGQEYGLEAHFLEIFDSVVNIIEGACGIYETSLLWAKVPLPLLLDWLVLISGWMVKIAMGVPVPQLAVLRREQVSRALPERLDRVEVHKQYYVLIEMHRTQGVSLNADLLMDQLYFVWASQRSKQSPKTLSKKPMD